MMVREGQAVVLRDSISQVKKSHTTLEPWATNEGLLQREATSLDFIFPEMCV